MGIIGEDPYRLACNSKFGAIYSFLFCFLFSLCVCLAFFETRFLCVSLDVLEFGVDKTATELKEIHLLPSIGTKGMCHHCQLEAIS